MKTPQAILGVVVAGLALAALVTFYDSSKPGIQTERHANEAAEKMDLLTPASSIAHDFAVLPKSVHSTSAISIAEEFAELPKSNLHHPQPATRCFPARYRFEKVVDRRWSARRTEVADLPPDTPP